MEEFLAVQTYFKLSHSNQREKNMQEVIKKINELISSNFDESLNLQLAKVRDTLADIENNTPNVFDKLEVSNVKTKVSKMIMQLQIVWDDLFMLHERFVNEKEGQS